jgi:hypothetical protein
LRVDDEIRLPDLSKILQISRSGDPTLKPRRLAGSLARGSYSVSRSLAVELEGSLRRVDHDFGWDLTRLDTTDTLYVSTMAGPRGSGWVSHGGIGFQWRPGPVRLHGLGWARGGSDRLSPQAGSPPRYGADGAADFRVVLFRGDLPLEAGFELHAQGPRRGIAREPGWATLDAAIRADFGNAGAFFEFVNVLDRRVPSAVFDVIQDRAVAMPERTFHFGIVWYLLD